MESKLLFIVLIIFLIVAIVHRRKEYFYQSSRCENCGNLPIESPVDSLDCCNNFTIVSFRPSTVFGVSPRLRSDIVFNNFVACAYTTNKIEIKSDGSPWRPVIHVKDLCNAFISGIEAPKELVSGQSFNVGIKNGNFTVKDLAESAQRVVTGSELVFLNQHTDPRTYKVSFKKILTTLKDYFKPEWSLDKGGYELVNFF